MTLNISSLIFLVAVISGCSNSQTKIQDAALVSVPSIENSMAQMDMNEFALRGY
jgi:hypothetical protein